MLETKTHFKNELKSAASLILTFSLPFLPHYQNHLNAPTEKGTLPSQLGIWRLRSLQVGGNLVAQGSWATLQLCSDVSLTSVEEVSRHIRTMEVTQWELTSQGELFTSILTFSSYIDRFNPILEDCSAEILNNHDLFLSIGCIHISIIKSKNVQMRQYARI